MLNLFNARALGGFGMLNTVGTAQWMRDDLVALFINWDGSKCVGYFLRLTLYVAYAMQYRFNVRLNVTVCYLTQKLNCR